MRCGTKLSHRRAIIEDSNVVKHDRVNHQAYRLSHHIYITTFAFVSHDTVSENPFERDKRKF